MDLPAVLRPLAVNESSAERQFDATASRLRRARESGDAPRSSDLCGAVAFAAGVVSLAVMLPEIAVLSQSSIREAAAGRADASILLLLVGTAIVLPMAAGASASLFANVVQAGGLPLRFPVLSLGRFNLLDGLRRIFSRDAVFALLRGAIAIAALSATVGPFAYRVLAQTLHSPDAGTLGTIAWNSALCIAIVGAVLGGVFGGADFAFAVVRWRKRLRMTLEEFKRDQKETEGDPLLRSRRRSMQRQHSSSAVGRLAEAAFVVVNPTHLAVALEYRPPMVAVPRVLIRAADHAALRLREEAVRAAVPLVEDAPLARALFNLSSSGESIPFELYVAVAAVVVALTRRGLLR
ncbi:MAG: EscU/YscU/HrcU family type III secretion system export apparatus switch protein [Candidatus Eremiobacteraeota bacterium]|nr:EscU/YscU/HrcU family type III secretion system export apparatus switch protein [Candidatus Eremiobacteraeota bacterium]